MGAGTGVIMARAGCILLMALVFGVGGCTTRPPEQPDATAELSFYIEVDRRKSSCLMGCSFVYPGLSDQEELLAVGGFNPIRSSIRRTPSSTDAKPSRARCISASTS